MTERRAPEDLRAACDATLVELGANDPNLRLVESTSASATSFPRFAATFPDRSSNAGATDSSVASAAALAAAEGRTMFAAGPIAEVVVRPYFEIRESICRPARNVKILATDGGLPGEPAPAPFPMLEDIGLMRALPGMTVVVPADAPTAAAATRAIAGFAGPAYLRLAPQALPNVTDGSFHIGRAPVLCEGADLTIVAIGALLRTALDVAGELGRVGVSVRVLDFASVKPFDEKALLRAARETGAILTMEEHSVLTGVGALVASATAEEAPVPVRRVGVPDVFAETPATGDLRDRLGLSRERCLEEAWTLLRARGKVQ